MDATKQPGIKIDAIVLAESHFKRQPTVPEKVDNIITFEVKNTITEDKKRLITELNTILNSDNDPVFGKFLFIGIFSADENSNMSLDDFSKANAVAVIIPYVREEIQNRMMKAGLPMMGIIPPVNFIALVNNESK